MGMTHLKDQIDIAQTAAPQRAYGRLIVEADLAKSGVTRCANLRQEGSFRALFPRNHSGGVEAVMLNTAGGITGGDHFTVQGTAKVGAKLTITTQAAERIYRAVGDKPGKLETDLSVGDDARLNWMPQETILFDGCALSRTLTVNVATTSTFLLVEPLVFGRRASGETVTSGYFHDRVTILRDGIPIYLDGIKMTGNMAATLSGRATGAGAAAAASIVYYHADAHLFLDAVRCMLPDTAGATLLADNLLLVRTLAEDSFMLRKTLVPVLTCLNNDTLPKNWRL